MFSSMTMASSTTRPIARTNARRVSVFTLKPASDIRANVPMRDTGIVTSGMSDARKVRKNTNMTNATSSDASKIVVYTALIERSMNTELSFATSICTPGGRSRRTLVSSSRTPADKSSGLAVAWRITPTPTESRPFKRTLERSSTEPI